MRDKRVKVPNTIDNRPASPKDISYAASIGVKLPVDATKSDAKALIDRDLDNDEPARPEFIAYARAMGMLCSDYIGNKALHNQLFDNISLEDKTALFCFCVYKFHFDDSNENLLEHPRRALFEEFGRKFSKDGYFTLSLEDYLGEDSVAFGKSTKEVNGVKKNIYGGSIYGRAYKEAMKYLKENLQ